MCLGALVVKTRRTINHQDTKTPSLDQRVQRPACGRIRSSRRLDATTDCLGVLVVEKCRRSSRREEALTFFCVWNPQISQMNADFIFYLRNPRHLRIKQKSPLCALVPWWLKPAGQSTTKTQRHQVWISACSVRPVAGFGRAAGSTLQRIVLVSWWLRNAAVAADVRRLQLKNRK